MILRDPTDTNYFTLANTLDAYPSHVEFGFASSIIDFHLTNRFKSLFLIERFTNFSFYDPLYFNQATTFIRHNEFTFEKYPQYLSSFVASHLSLCIRIMHLLAFFNVSQIIFILKYVTILTHE
jgi:hypothetical protein